MGPILRFIERADQRAISLSVGKLADSRLLGPIAKLLFRLRYFPKTSRTLKPQGGFRTLNEFFARQMRIERGDLPRADLFSPACGKLVAGGPILDGTLLQAKGRTYTIEALLGGRSDLAAELAGGSYATIYLSPRDYHRFHAPCAARLVSVCRIPGRLLPVDDRTRRSLDDLFTKNERVVFELSGGRGKVALIAVGAFLVSGIVVTAAPVPMIAHRDKPPKPHRFHSQPEIEAAGELGYFRFGSTVILVAGPGYAPLPEDGEGRHVSIADPLG